MQQKNLLTLEEVCISYRDTPVVKNVSFSLAEGECLVIVGESGSGKSTILKAVQSLLSKEGRITSGRILLQGEEITHLAEKRRQELAGKVFSMVFQQTLASFCPIRTVGAQLYEAASAHSSLSKVEFLGAVRPLMKRLALEESVLKAYPFQLSGGMGQRIGILSAMLMKPRLLLADEPTSALDTITQHEVVALLQEVKASEQLGLLLVTHHIGVAYRLADKILVMRQGEVVEYGDKAAIFAHPKESYTRELIQSVPSLRQIR